jgi:hypothetical protein
MCITVVVILWILSHSQSCPSFSWCANTLIWPCKACPAPNRVPSSSTVTGPKMEHPSWSTSIHDLSLPVPGSCHLRKHTFNVIKSTFVQALLCVILWADLMSTSYKRLNVGRMIEGRKVVTTSSDGGMCHNLGLEGGRTSTLESRYKKEGMGSA